MNVNTAVVGPLIAFLRQIVIECQAQCLLLLNIASDDDRRKSSLGDVVHATSHISHFRGRT